MPRPTEPLLFFLKVRRLNDHAEQDAGGAADQVVP